MKNTIVLIRDIFYGSNMRAKRNFGDFFADRITIACTEPSLLSMVNRLQKVVDCEFASINSKHLADFMADAQSDRQLSILSWIRKYPAIVAAMCTMKGEDFDVFVEQIQVDQVESLGVAIAAPKYQVGITVECLSPLAHGSESKSGNNTLFRRMNVLDSSGGVQALPFYAGNAIRGQLRDLLADDFLARIGLLPIEGKPQIELWFFHAIYAGGALSETSAATKVIEKLLGGNGAQRSEGFYRFRNMLPALSALGCALGNRILNGRFQSADIRPLCKEWSNGDIPVSSLFDWTFLTRREDNEDHDDTVAMIANTEVLKQGTVLVGGFDFDGNATDNEKSAICHGLEMLSKRGKIGAENRRGLGQVCITIANGFDSTPYTDFLETNKKEIRDFLVEIGASKEFKLE